MRFKTWLLTGTSIGLMAVAPIPANAQGAELQSAIQAFLQAQASGDAAALEAAQSTLTNECIVAGFSSVDECLANGGSAPAAPAVDNSAAEAEAAARAEAEQRAAEEAQAAAEAEARAAAEAEAQAAAEAEAAAAQAAADEQARHAEEAAAREAEAQAAAEAEARAASEQQAAEEAAAAAAREQEEAAARAAAEQEAADKAAADQKAADEAAAAAAAAQEAPAVEAPVPDASPAIVPAPDAAPVPDAGPAIVPAPDAAEPDYGAELAAQVRAYEDAVTELLNGGDRAAITPRLDAARAEITRICEFLGNGDIVSCLDSYGLALPEVPGLAAEPPVDQPAVDQPAEQPEAQPEAPIEQPAPLEETTSDGQAAEPITSLPAGIDAEQIAPLLDSAKDDTIAPPPGPSGEAAVAPPVEIAPSIVTVDTLPANDEAAQSQEIRDIVATPIPLVLDEAGTQVTATENTTVNQTIVNNYITNIVNNVDNSVTNNTNVTNNQNTTNIGQQNNVQNNYVQIVEAPVLQPTSTGDAIAQVILQIGSQLIVNSIGQDTNRFYNPQQDEIFYEDLRGGRTREVITRPDGTQVITVRNRNGDILRRSRITPDGQEYILAYFDDRYENNLNTWRDPGLDLPPLRLNIPSRDYVLDARYADDRQLATFFSQPPVEQVARLYSIDEVKRSARVRDSVRKLEVGNLTFDTGAATIGRDQVGSLQSVANAMLTLLRTNPNETFLIEGHTDAVGQDISNLRLSDARAATVARILSDFYGVPPENLATQGYGERYLKIRTESAERENRRVTIRRITPLVTVASR